MRRSASALLSLSKLSTTNLLTSSLSTLILCVLILSTLGFAAAADRITGPVVSSQLIKLSAGVPPKAQPQYDQGRVDPSIRLGMMLLTVPSASQQKAIDRLLAQQQDPRSPQYRKWLTPEQYADRFGRSPNDIQKLTTWLLSQGFTVSSVAGGRDFIVFSGTAVQAESAFQTEIHNFEVEGEKHFSNTTSPSIPTALSGIVTGIRGLNNFPLKSNAVHIKPDYTFPVSGGTLHFIAPGDIATMYDLAPLYNAGIDGTGQKLAVIGETDVYLADLADFRSGFGLSAISCPTNASDVITSCNTSNFRYVVYPNDTDPGSPNSLQDDLPEADIDIEWSGAVARNAQIVYVNAPQSGVGASLSYAIDQKLAPVITMSYTAPCELAEAGFIPSDEAEFQKANLQGITFMNSSGDSGAAECDFNSNLAVNGYAVAYPASSPEVTAVGGTLIPYTEYTSTFWSPTNATDGGSALSYIPEQAWNDAQEWGTFCTANPTNSNCTGNGMTNWESAQSVVGIVAGGGGPSNCYTESAGVCSGGFPQPAYQQGLSIPGQTIATRFTPDVSLLASVYWPGYIVCTAADELGFTGTTSTCAPGGAAGITNNLTNYGYSFGGTSISSPVFAGIVTLMNQYLSSSSGLGNINSALYFLAETPANGAFNKVTTGSNGAYCTAGTPSNQPVALQCPAVVPPATNGFLGFDASKFDATTSYNLVTGLGSVDANKLAIAWKGITVTSTTTSIQAAPTTVFAGQSVTLTATVTPSTATGLVAFYNNGSTTALGTGTLSGGTATLSTTSLPVGTDNISATYAGDVKDDPSSSTTDAVVTVQPTPTFTLSAPTTPGTVPAGESTTSTFTVTPTGGATTFAAAVTFACNGLPDATVSCSFNTGQANPTQIAAGSGATQVTLTITTSGPNPAQAGGQRRRADSRSPFLPLALPLAGIVMAGFAGRKMSRHSAIAGLCVSLVLLGLLVACGSSSTPPVAVSSVSANPTAVYPNYPGANGSPAWPTSTATLSVTVTNDSQNKGVTWMAGLGSITSTAATTASYTAPNIIVGLAGTDTVKATSVADPTKSGNGTVTLKPATVPTAVVGSAYGITVTATEGPTTNTTSNIALTVQ